MELLKIGPLADRAFKQVLPIIKNLHAGRNRQRIDLTMYPAVMLRNSSISDNGRRSFWANQESQVTSSRRISKREVSSNELNAS